LEVVVCCRVGRGGLLLLLLLLSVLLSVLLAVLLARRWFWCRVES
jgi:hypothetical protein